MTIGERIKARRLEIGLSVDQLAEAIGKNRATVYRYESNDIEKYTIDVLYPLAEALGTTPAYLMGWDEDIDQNKSEVAVDPINVGSTKVQSITITGQAGAGKSNLINRAYTKTLTPWGKPPLGKRSGKRIIHRTPKQPPEQTVFVSYSHKEDDLPVGISEHLRQQLGAIELPEYNLVYTYAKDGTSKMRRLNDEQFSALNAILDQMPDTEEE